MKVPIDYKGKVILKFSTSEFGLIKDKYIDLLNDQKNEIVYIDTIDDIIYIYTFDDQNNKNLLCKYMYADKYDCYTSMVYEKMNSICKIIKLIE
jgi:hypothetical protein